MFNSNLTDAEVEANYRRSQGLDTKEVGPKEGLKNLVNSKLRAKGYREIKGDKPKKQLFAILNSLK